MTFVQSPSLYFCLRDFTLSVLPAGTEFKVSDLMKKKCQVSLISVVIKVFASTHKERDEEWAPNGMFLVLQLWELEKKKEAFDLKDQRFGNFWHLMGCLKLLFLIKIFVQKILPWQVVKFMLFPHYFF